MLNNRGPAMAIASLTQAPHTVKIPFVHFPPNEYMAFVIKLWADPAGTQQLVKATNPTTPIMANGSNQITTDVNNMDLTGVPIGDYYVGVTPMVGPTAGTLVAGSQVMTAAGQDIIVSGTTIGNPIWS